MNGETTLLCRGLADPADLAEHRRIEAEPHTAVRDGLR
jgi:hypothetical protein